MDSDHNDAGMAAPNLKGDTTRQGTTSRLATGARERLERVRSRVGGRKRDVKWEMGEKGEEKTGMWV
jgi:hypothetical protein